MRSLPLRAAACRLRSGALWGLTLASLLVACGNEAGSGGPCTPGTRRCEDRAIMLCQEGGAWESVVVCPIATSTCQEGSCVPLGFEDVASADAPDDGAEELPLADLPVVPDETQAEPPPYLEVAEAFLDSPTPDASPDQGPDLSPDQNPELTDVLPDDPESIEDIPGDETSEVTHPEEISEGILELSEPTPDVPDLGPELGPETSEPLPEAIDEPSPPACGDAHLDPGEDCEPGQGVSSS